MVPLTKKRDVYFRALLFLTPYRIRHCEEESQQMKTGKRQGGGGRWRNFVGNVERSRKISEARSNYS